MINHGALTDALITQLVTDTGELVGDGVAPTAGGWLAGQPNQSVYVPYIVLASQGASVMINDLDGNLDWTVTWSMRYFAGSRKQVDWIANKARNAIDGGPNNVLYKTFGTTPQYKITAVQWTNLGAVQRVDTVNPPYWQVFDSFGLVCSRTSFTPTM